MAAERIVTAAPALGWRQTVTFGPQGGRILEAAFHMDVEAPSRQINSALDKISRCIDRQIAYYDLIDAKLQVAALRVKLSQHAAEIELVHARSEAAWDALEGRRGAWNTERMNANEKAAVAGAEASLDRDKVNYEFWCKRVDELTEVVSQDAPELSSDRNAGHAKG
jgi:hypothetical protein